LAEVIMMARKLELFVAGLCTWFAWSGNADAQPADPYAPAPAAPTRKTVVAPPAPAKAPAAPAKAPPAPATAAPAPDVAFAREQAKAALATAAQSRELAACLRPAAAKVDLAARALDAARTQAQHTAREAELERASKALRACYDPLFDGGALAVERCEDGLFDGDGPTGRRCGQRPIVGSKPLKGRTGFGQIRVAHGVPDAATIGAALRDRIATLQQCQDQAIARTGRVEGELDIGLVLPAAQGRAVPFGVAMRNVAVGDQPMRRCIAAALMGTAFPTTPAGALVDLRLMLATEGGPSGRMPPARR
jgi:hypothetical protein